MPSEVVEIEAKIGALSLDDKSRLIRALIAELDGPADADVDRAWLQEAQRRYREVVEGQVQPVPGERVFRESPLAGQTVKLEFHAEAELELIEAAEYYEVQVSGLGERFETEIRRATDLLLERPEIGSPVDPVLRRFVLNRLPITLYYSVTSDVLVSKSSHTRVGAQAIGSRGSTASAIDNGSKTGLRSFQSKGAACKRSFK